MFHRMTGIAAIGFALSVIISNAYLIVTGPPPRAGADLADVTAYYTEKATPVSVVVGLFAINAVFLAIAGAGAFTRLRQLERDGEGWSMIGLVGVLFIGLIFASVAACQLAIVAAPASPAVEGLWNLHNSFFAINHVGLAVAMLGLSMGGLRTGLIRTWHAYLGLTGASIALVAAVLAPLSGTGNAPWASIIGFVAFGCWMLWLLIFGATLLRTGSTIPSRAPAMA